MGNFEVVAGFTCDPEHSEGQAEGLPKMFEERSSEFRRN